MKCEDEIAGYCKKKVMYEKYANIIGCNKCCMKCLEPCSNICDIALDKRGEYIEGKR